MLLDVFRQVVTGVLHLHSLHIAHRDLKTDNVLVTVSDPIHVKVADYGSAVSLNVVNAGVICC